tara:strand:+ start:940 stop:1647 length:708 start_codon:yes stop_codon:yes gene_type:complete
MINQDKWIKSLPGKNTSMSNVSNQLDHNKWINTIPKKNTTNSFQKYSLITTLFIFGLLFVSVVKNETRNLQKEINNLESSVNIIKHNLDQANLDNEVITSPENISLLAKEYLNINLVSYKRSQIKNLTKESDNFFKVDKVEEKENNFSKNVKSKVTKSIEKKKKEIEKLQALYSNPELIPGEIKTKVRHQIKQKKTELRNIYHSPKDAETLKKFGKWGAVQVVKAFLGIPMVPGR